MSTVESYMYEKISAILIGIIIIIALIFYAGQVIEKAGANAESLVARDIRMAIESIQSVKGMVFVHYTLPDNFNNITINETTVKMRRATFPFFMDMTRNLEIINLGPDLPTKRVILYADKNNISISSMDSKALYPYHPGFSFCKQLDKNLFFNIESDFASQLEPEAQSIISESGVKINIEFITPPTPDRRGIIIYAPEKYESIACSLKNRLNNNQARGMAVEDFGQIDDKYALYFSLPFSRYTKELMRFGKDTSEIDALVSNVLTTSLVINNHFEEIEMYVYGYDKDHFFIKLSSFLRIIAEDLHE